jgi:hypothetical protein
VAELPTGTLTFVWRVPLSWVGRLFREVILSIRRGEHRELPSGG